MSKAEQRQNGNAWCIGIAGLLALMALLFPGAVSDAFSLSWDEDDTGDEGILYVNYAFPQHWSEPSLYVPFWGYRFHPYYALMDCDIEPEEALVIVDGESFGEADDFDGFPSYLYLNPGYHRVEFREEGHRSLIVHGQFRTGSFIRLDRELTEGMGEELADLGQPREINESQTLPGQPEPVSDERHPETIPPVTSGEAGSNSSNDAEPGSIGEGEDLNLPQTEPPTPVDAGFLKLAVNPGDASVYVDDEFFGSGDEVSRLHGYIRLEPGIHFIQIVRPGFHSKDLEVNMVPGEKQHLDVWLERKSP